MYYRARLRQFELNEQDLVTMRIAIIDSGIDINHKRLRGCRCTGVSIELNSSDELAITDEYNDSLGHGTSLAAIIHRISPSAELVAVRIFHQELAATERLLCESLNWCLNNDIDIINLSLGVQTSSPSTELYQLCADAYERNVVIISAAHTDLSYESYPAYFPTVFGVTWGKVGSDTEYGFIPGSPIEFIARGTLQRIAWKNGGFTISSGTSLACAYFTGITAKTMRSFNYTSSIDSLNTKLKEGAMPGLTPLQFGGKAYNDNVPTIKSDGVKKDLEGVFRRRFSDWIGNLAVFPASEKEMNAFSNFPEYCISPVVQYFDYPRNLAYASPGKTEPNGDVTRSDRFERFDTLVTGYFTDQLFETNIKYGTELLTKSLSFGKNIFSYDRRLQAHIEQYRTKQGYSGAVYVPEVTEEHYEELLPFRFLGSVDVPMLCVLGTSNRQGKFTTQLRIKEILEQEGYRIGFLSTEPQGELFGATHSFPYGYRGTVSLEKKKWSYYLRILTRGMQEYLEPHLILTGTQGTSIPRGKSRKHLGNETDTLDFMIGVNPDAFVCAINPQDTIGYIKDTCETFRIYCGAEPLFFVMTPWMREFQKVKNGRTMARHRFLDDEEKHTKMGNFQEEIGKPVFDIMDKANDGTILELIQGFFSKRQ